MGFNPLEHQGIPLDGRLRSWREPDVEPIDPDHSDPYTRCRVITLNGVDLTGWVATCAGAPRGRSVP